MTTLAGKYIVGMFTYGFLRGIRAEYKPPHDIIGYQLGLSVVNGMVYVFPPHGIPRLFDIANRADVYFSGKDPEKYPSIYVELFGISKNKHIIL